MSRFASIWLVLTNFVAAGIKSDEKKAKIDIEVEKDLIDLKTEGILLSKAR